MAIDAIACWRDGSASVGSDGALSVGQYAPLILRISSGCSATSEFRLSVIFAENAGSSTVLPSGAVYSTSTSPAVSRPKVPSASLAAATDSEPGSSQPLWLR